MVTDHLHGFVQRWLVVAGIVDSASRRLIRELIGLDKVQLAYVGRVFAHFARYQVDHALDEIGCLWTTGSAIRVGRHFIGKDQVEAEVHIGDIVRTTRDGETEGNHDYIGKDLRIRSRGRRCHGP